MNIILAACDGREGNPGEYRDYRFKARTAKRRASVLSLKAQIPKSSVRG